MEWNRSFVHIPPIILQETPLMIRAHAHPMIGGFCKAIRWEWLATVHWNIFLFGKKDKTRHVEGRCAVHHRCWRAVRRQRWCERARSAQEQTIPSNCFGEHYGRKCTEKCTDCTEFSVRFTARFSAFSCTNLVQSVHFQCMSFFLCTL